MMRITLRRRFDQYELLDGWFRSYSAITAHIDKFAFWYPQGTLRGTLNLALESRFWNRRIYLSVHDGGVAAWDNDGGYAWSLGTSIGVWRIELERRRCRGNAMVADRNRQAILHLIGADPAYRPNRLANATWFQL